MKKNHNSLLKKAGIFATVVGISFTINAQVGIGTTGPDADLDIVSTAATGNTLQVNSDNTTNTSTSALLRNLGLGISLNIEGLNIANTKPGLQINQFGTGYGMYNVMEGSGIGIYNQLLGTSTIGMYQDLSQNGGTGDYIDLGIQDGTGVFVNGSNNVNAPTSGGDVIAFRGIVNTLTPYTLTPPQIFGSVFFGEQYGIGHGIYIDHFGQQGRSAEFIARGINNPEPAILGFNLGQGSAILAVNYNNNLANQIVVADFGYYGTDLDDHVAVRGVSQPAASLGIGVLGVGNWYGVYSIGNFGSSGFKTFIIDHPEDPANKMLRHFSIESNEVLNMYRGIESFDANGKATISLPSYYDSINMNPSYQLTPIGAAMPNLYIACEINNGQFVIAGGEPNKKVSWQITAERNDPYMQQNASDRDAVVTKEGERKGKYLNPELHGQSKEKGMFYIANNQNIKPSKIANSSLKNLSEIETKRTKDSKSAAIKE